MLLSMLSFVETPLFTRLVYDYLSDEECGALQAHLAQDPESGEARTAKGIIWMLTIYAKNETANIPSHVLRKIRQELEDD